MINIGFGNLNLPKLHFAFQCQHNFICCSECYSC